MKPESQDQGWADFEQTTQSNPVGAQELLERYSEFKRFIAELPRKELVERRWLATTDDLSPLATIFFDLPHASQPTLFRKSAKSDEKILGVWLSRARSEAEYIAITQDLPAFTKLTQGELREVALRSVDPQAARLLPTIIAKLGIILVYVRALPGMKADGAVFHLSTGHPVIAMSLRFPRLDYFWFTLRHELSHLVLHNEKLKEPVFFDIEADESDKYEKAANRLAKDSIVHRESWRNCAPKYDTSDNAVYAYAAEQGVHPSLIAGLLRKESGNYKRYSSIINEHDVRELIFQP